MTWNSVRVVSQAEDANSRNRRTMEDAHFAVDNFAQVQGQGMFCVCDGHGGNLIVDFLKENLVPVLAKHVGTISSTSSPDPAESKSRSLCCSRGLKSPKKRQSKQNIDVLEQIMAALSALDQMSADITTSGSTVAICLIRPGLKDGSRHMFVANLGDTRVVLSNKDGSSKRLTYDHNTSDAAEVKRIEESGGFMLRGRILGILSVARAIGDHTMKKYVISTPHTADLELSGKEDFVIVACDGVWDVLKDEQATEFVRNGIKEKKFSEQEAAQNLVQKALDEGSQDNITAIVVFL